MPRPPVLSPIRQQIFEYIVTFKAEHDGNSPSIRQMAEKFQRSTNTVSYDLAYMEVIGLIERGGKGESRMIKVVGAKWVSPLEVKIAQFDKELLMQFDTTHR